MSVVNRKLAVGSWQLAVGSWQEAVGSGQWAKAKEGNARFGERAHGVRLCLPTRTL
jgi:hypothetical protein